jgi:hypothetical protein
MRHRAWIAAAAIALASAPARAHQPVPYSPYEQETIERALAKVKGVVEPRPEGKILEGVEVITLDVFEDRDPLPAFLTPIANWFHATSRKSVIEREVLLARGERWDQALVDQTARNLRGLDQLSLVLCVPLRGGAPDRVRLLVVTKDVWSLRLNSNFRFADGRLQYLLLQPSEQNLLGTHQQILGNFVMDPATISFGGQYVLPRIAGSRIRASLSASGIVNRDTGKVEGSYGSFSYGQPLYSIRTRWAWDANIAWDQEIVRRFIAGLPTDFDPTSGDCAISATPAASDHQRCQYKKDAVSGSFGVTRSFGTALKHDIGFGVSAIRKQYRTLDLSGLTSDQQAAYVRGFVPVSDSQTGPYVEYHTYSTRYFDVLDLDTMGLTESIQEGHDVTVRVSPVLRALNSDRDFVDLYASATYTWRLGDGLARVAVAHDAALTTSGVPDGSFSAALRIATPRFGHGRLVFDARMLDRYANYLNLKSTLGGDGRLRGYPASMFLGSNLVSANLEYRSDPLEIAAIQLGFTLFADAGDAFDTWKQLQLKQSCGLGLRAVFPQLQRSVMRVDLGFPLTQGALPPSQAHGDVVVTFGQAF